MAIGVVDVLRANPTSHVLKLDHLWVRRTTVRFSAQQGCFSGMASACPRWVRLDGQHSRRAHTG